MNCRAVLSLITILITNTIFAQYKISGSTVDKTDDSYPLIGATVSLEATNDSTNKIGSTTDTGGHFIFSDLPSGNYTFKAYYVGFTTYQKTVNIFNSDTELGIIKMSPASTTLQN